MGPRMPVARAPTSKGGPSCNTGGRDSGCIASTAAGAVSSGGDTADHDGSRLTSRRRASKRPPGRGAAGPVPVPGRAKVGGGATGSTLLGATSSCPEGLSSGLSGSAGCRWTLGSAGVGDGSRRTSRRRLNRRPAGPALVPGRARVGGGATGLTSLGTTSSCTEGLTSGSSARGCWRWISGIAGLGNGAGSLPATRHGLTSACSLPGMRPDVPSFGESSRCSLADVTP